MICSGKIPPSRIDLHRVYFRRRSQLQFEFGSCVTPPSPENADTADVARWFASEVQPHERMLRAWLRDRFPKLTDIDDLVQESYARLIRARASGKVANAKNYLFATARNAVFDLVRHNAALRVESIEEISSLSV